MILTHKSITPKIHETSFVAENATIIGKVNLEADTGIWFGAVLRGDVEQISIGERTNIQDNAVVHTSKGFPTTLGSDITVGHGAIIHGCTIKDRVLVGMGAILLDGAVVESDCMIGAGALIPPGKVIPAGSLVVGSPGKVVRSLTETELESLKASAQRYVAYSKEYK